MSIPHPYSQLQFEYASLLSAMQITRKADVYATAGRLLKNMDHYQPVNRVTGIPIAWIAASFEREASSRFNLSPAQGDPWNRPSTHVPRNRGPFGSWTAAALDAYHLNGLDKVGAANWTMELCCYYGELFNGMGYRDYHRMHSPYLWGGTSIQQVGKYTSDGQFDPDHFDTQLGIMPIIFAMGDMDRTLVIPREKFLVIPAPIPAPVGLNDARSLQQALNDLGEHPPLVVDGSYGKNTMAAVKAFQIAYKLQPDGIAGPEVRGKIAELLAALKQGN